MLIFNIFYINDILDIHYLFISLT